MSYRATSGNDRWTVPRYGDPSNTLIDGLGGTDSLSFDRLPMSRFNITRDSQGIVHVDSISGASSTYHLQLVNVEQLTFSNGHQSINLNTYFGDTQAPVISSMTPAYGASNVAINSNLVFNFNEAIQRGNGVITLQTADGITVESFDAATSMRLQFSGSQLTITPSSILDNQTSYTVLLNSGTVKDTSDNAFTGNRLSFTTVADAPPTADAGKASIAEDTILQGHLPAGHDPEGQALNYALVDNPAHGELVVNADGSYSYTPAANYSGADSFTYSVSDGHASSDPALISITVTPVQDIFTGTSGNDSLAGTSGNDLLNGAGGNDTLDGGGGLDMAQFSAALASYQISHDANSLMVTDTRTSGQTDGMDTLQNVERLVFSDKNLAFDLDGASGDVAKVLGAVFGADAVHNNKFVGIGLKFADKGLSEEQLMDLALQARFGAHPSNQNVAKLLYTNVHGAAPDATTLADFVAQLDSGSLSNAQLGVQFADDSQNLVNIDLVGLTNSGLEYLPR